MRRATWRTACTTLLLATLVSMMWTRVASAADSSFSRNLVDTVEQASISAGRSDTTCADGDDVASERDVVPDRGDDLPRG